MSHQLKVVVLGLTHDHVWSHLTDLHRSSGVELLGVADPNLPLLTKAREHVGCPTYTDYEELLAAGADLAYIFSDNQTSAFLATAAAEQGLHVMVEKPLGVDADAASVIQLAAQKQGVRLMVNWPIAWSPAVHTALAFALEGKIGRIWQVKYRSAHAGPRELGCSSYFCEWLYDERLNGGGALIDYGCYGLALARTLMGMPIAVKAQSGTWVREDMAAEDNAVILLEYEKGSAIAEASWSQQGDISSYVVAIYGDKGTLIADAKPGGTVTHATQQDPMGTVIDLSDPPRHLRHATAHWVWALAEDRPFMPLVQGDIGLDTQRLITIAKQACKVDGTPVDAEA